MTPEHKAIKKLFPDLSDEEQVEAAENLARYLRAIIGVHEDISSDPERYAQFRALTEEVRARSMEDERSSITSPHANIPS